MGQCRSSESKRAKAAKKQETALVAGSGLIALNVTVPEQEAVPQIQIREMAKFEALSSAVSAELGDKRATHEVMIEFCGSAMDPEARLRDEAVCDVRCTFTLEPAELIWVLLAGS